LLLPEQSLQNAKLRSSSLNIPSDRLKLWIKVVIPSQAFSWHESAHKRKIADRLGSTSLKLNLPLGNGI